MTKAAAILSFIIGAMSIAAGGKVLQGWQPGWSVLNGLPLYNFAMGIFTVLVPTILIWKNHRYAMFAALVTLSVHALVTLLLLTFFRDAVATQSILAMTSRSAVWIVIIALLYFAKK
jgi:hypothetical protein